MKTFFRQSMQSLLAMMLILGIVLTSGCRGCLWNSPGNEEEESTTEREKKEKKPDFIHRTPVLLPGHFPPKYDPQKEKELANLNPDVRAATEEQNNAAIRYNRHKLGHWVEAHLSVIANNFNADGRLQAVSVTPALEKVPVPSTDYFARTERPFALTKGEWKNLEISLFLPRRDGAIPSALVDYDLGHSGGVPFVSLAQGTPLMKSFQYHLVLLSERPDSYNFVKMVDSVRMRGPQGADSRLNHFYLVVPSILGEPVPLPRQALFWTTIAYVIWDDCDPDRLSRDQQEALLDWLHFGGQLILSGPDCLSKLQNSFLASYLPAQFEGSKNLSNTDFEELNRNWSIPLPKRKIGVRTISIAEQSPLLGIQFKPHESAQFVEGTGELLIERRLGRGRIVVSSFSLASPAIRKWPSFESFFNGALLRRPARQFWGSANDVRVRWAEKAASNYDPLVGSTLRYLSRDLSAGGTSSTPTYSIEKEMPGEADPRAWMINEEVRFDISERVLSSPDFQNFFGGYQDSPQSGVAGWNDDSGISAAARATLLQAAGIVPPSSTFVLKMLAIYLSVLVPLNWLVFKLLGRVEWAWIAAPFIAIAGAVMVVKLASLDVGFVRSNTQVGLVEIHSDYPRAHVAEYSALYTSLSTRYDVELDNLSAQSLPFASVSQGQERKRAERLKGITLKRTAINRMEGLPIQSNSTGLLHTEFLLDLGGVINTEFSEFGEPLSINNDTLVSIRNAGVLQCDAQGTIRLAWVGELPSGSTAPLNFAPLPEKDYAEQWRRIELFGSSEHVARKLWNKYFEQRLSIGLDELRQVDEISQDWDRIVSMLQRNADSDSQLYTQKEFEDVISSISIRAGIQIGRLFDVLTQLSLRPGEVRLIGSTDQGLGRTKFAPEATRHERQTLVVVHLRQPKLATARRDQNSPLDFSAVSNLDWEREQVEDDE
jgi:hypothetical protein